MGFQKKKNMIVITVCTVSSFILYQLYFFFTITAETGAGGESNQKILYTAVDPKRHRKIPVLNPNEIAEDNMVVHIRSEDDKYINEKGMIRGVLYSQFGLYRNQNEHFKCLNSKQKIPYSQLNDDYCDCEDGTDEPSTGACPKSTFYCDLQYFKKHAHLNMVPSGKVNDGICDCCDGSDEFDGKHEQLLSQYLKNTRRYFDICPYVC